MNDLCARVTTTLALVPLLVVVCIFTAYGLDEFPWNPAWFVDSLQPLALATTLFAILMALATWRTYVRWVLSRSVGFGVLTAATIAQVCFWQPLFATSSCGMEDALMLSQATAGIGLWLVGGALVWWFAVLRSDKPVFTRGVRRKMMTPNAVRLVIGIALAPLLPAVTMIAYFAVEESGLVGDSYVALGLAYQVAAVLLVGVWWLLWRRTLRWTAWRTAGTTGLALLALLAPWLTLLSEQDAILSEGLVVTLLVAALLILWAAVLVFVWRRAIRLHSPRRLTYFVAGLLLFGLPLCLWADILWSINLGSYRQMLCQCVGQLLAAAVWLIGTAWLWRDSSAAGMVMSAADEPIATCPVCNYNLTGLHEVRCPECGWRDTVDGLVRRCLAERVVDP